MLCAKWFLHIFPSIFGIGRGFGVENPLGTRVILASTHRASPPSLAQTRVNQEGHPSKKAVHAQGRGP